MIWYGKIWKPFPQGCVVPTLFEVGIEVLEKTIVLKKTILISLFYYFLPFGDKLALYLNQFKIHIPKNDGFQVRLEFA